MCLYFCKSPGFPAERHDLCVPTGAGGVAGVTVRKLHGDAAGCCASWVLPSSQGVSKMGVSAKLGLWYNLHPFIFKV